MIKFKKFPADIGEVYLKFDEIYAHFNKRVDLINKRKTRPDIISVGI